MQSHELARRLLAEPDLPVAADGLGQELVVVGTYVGQWSPDQGKTLHDCFVVEVRPGKWGA